MWGQISSFALSALGLAVTANWLVGSHVRRISSIRHEVDLLNALPPSPVRNALHRKIQNDLWKHIRVAENSTTWRLIRAFKVLSAVSVVGWVFAVVATVWRAIDPREWVTMVMVVSLVFGAAMVAATFVLMKVLSPRLDAVIEAEPRVNYLAPDED